MYDDVAAALSAVSVLVCEQGQIRLTYRDGIDILDPQLTLISLLDRPTTQFGRYRPTGRINPIASFICGQVLMWSKGRDMLDERERSVKWGKGEKEERKGAE